MGAMGATPTPSPQHVFPVHIICPSHTNQHAPHTTHRWADLDDYALEAFTWAGFVKKEDPTKPLRRDCQTTSEVSAGGTDEVGPDGESTWIGRSLWPYPAMMLYQSPAPRPPPHKRQCYTCPHCKEKSPQTHLWKVRLTV
jgi:hypothetical protein